MSINAGLKYYMENNPPDKYLRRSKEEADIIEKESIKNLWILFYAGYAYRQMHTYYINEYKSKMGYINFCNWTWELGMTDEEYARYTNEQKSASKYVSYEVAIEIDQDVRAYRFDFLSQVEKELIR